MATSWAGCRVVRGPDWPPTIADDGGEGGVGTVVEIHPGQNHDGRSAGAADAATPVAASIEFGSVWVQWDTGVKSSHRCGADGKYDLRLLCPAGRQHEGVSCSECDEDCGGYCWRCHDCRDVVLCDRCYGDNKHDLAHAFCSYCAPDTHGVVLPSRSASQRLALKGIFVGAQVRRHDDQLSSADRDDIGGEAGKTGTVVEVENGSALVEWPGNIRTQHCLGAHGKVELKCVTVAPGGFCYPQHLPLLGQEAGQEHSNERREEESGQTEEGDGDALAVGSLAMMVNLDFDEGTLRMLQQQIDAWSPLVPEMSFIIGKIASINESNGGIEVQYPNLGMSVVLHPAIVSKVPRYRSGQDVMLKDENGTVGLMMEKLCVLDFDFNKYVEQVGVVVEQRADSNVLVKFGGEEVLLHPGCIESRTDRIRSAVEERRGSSPHPELTSPLRLSPVPRLRENLTAQLDTRQAMRRVFGPQSVSMGRSEAERGPDEFFDIILPALLGGRQSSKIIDNGYAQAAELQQDAFKSVMATFARSLDYSDADIGMIIADREPVGVLSMIVLFLCMIDGRLEQSDALLRMQPDMVNTPLTLENVTAMHLAAELGSPPFITMLLKHGTNLDDQDVSGETPMHVAAKWGKVEALSCLLDVGAKRDIVDSQGRLPVHSACYKRQTTAAKWLLEHGMGPDFSVNTPVTEKRVSLLLLAAEFGDKELATMLLARGSEVNVQEANGVTPMHAAATMGNMDAMSCLLQAGGMVNIKDSEGCLALHRACQNGHVLALRRLVEHGVEHDFPLAEHVDYESGDRSTPLLVAADFGSRTCVQQLVKYGARLDVQIQKTGNTPLHLALINHDAEESGRHKECMVESQNDPSDLADLIAQIQKELVFSGEKSNRNAAMACFLAQHGADMTVVNKEGKTPLDICPSELMKDYLIRYSTTERVTDFHGNDPLRLVATGEQSAQESISEMSSDENLLETSCTAEDLPQQLQHQTIKVVPHAETAQISRQDSERRTSATVSPSSSHGNHLHHGNHQPAGGQAEVAQPVQVKSTTPNRGLACNFANKPIPRKTPPAQVPPLG